MIQGFENYTASLTDYEANVLVPRLVKGLENRVGSQYAISNKRIFRLKGLVRNLIANSNGYYVATSIEEARNWSESARERARAIWAVADAVEAQSDGRLFL